MFLNGMVVNKIIQYIGYFMAVAGVVAFIWQKAIITEQRRDKVTHVEQKVANIERSMITKENVAQVVDSVFAAKLVPYIKDMNALRNSYVAFVKDRYIGANKPLTFDDFVKYMNGIEFELKMPIYDTVKIKITKKVK